MADISTRYGIGNDNVKIKMIDNGDGTFSQSVVMSGSIVDKRGLAINKPAANTVSPGTTYWSVDTDPHANAIEVSDGTKWVVI